MPNEERVRIESVDLIQSYIKEGEEYITLVLNLKTPIVFSGQEIGKVFCTVPNSPRWNMSYRRAELRAALDLQPAYIPRALTADKPDNPILLIPVFDKEDFPALIGKELSIIIKGEDGPWGPRLRVTHFLPKE